MIHLHQVGNCGDHVVIERVEHKWYPITLQWNLTLPLQEKPLVDNGIPAQPIKEF